MNKPPDDPGGHDPISQDDVPQVSQFVTIEDSSVDTDASYASIPSNNRKRSLTSHKICKSCNKRHKKRKGDVFKTTDCQCSIKTESNAPQSINNDVIMNNSPLTLEQNTPVSKTKEAIHYRSQYEHTDTAPYVVHIQKVSSTPNDNVSLHPVSFGRFLKNNTFRNIINGSLKKIGRNRLSLSFSDYTDANVFINDTRLTSNNFKVFIPSFLISRVGLIRGVPIDWSPEEIISNINVPLGCGNIIKVRRLNHKVTVNDNVTWKPTETVVLTFDGQVLPKRVYMCYTSLPVELYIYPTIQCYKCCRYGHTKVNCRSNPRCYKCGKDHFGENCSADDDYAVICCLCKGSHFATSKTCPEHLRQRNIKLHMAQSCVSYAEASKQFPSVSRSYADILATTPENYLNNRRPQFKPSSTQEPSRTQSYKKTVFLKPKSPSKTTKGYDHDFHNSVIQEYTSITSPGNKGDLVKSTQNNYEDVTIKAILSLIQLLTQSQLITPNNAAIIRDQVNSIIVSNNNGQTTIANSTMELSKC